MVAKRVLVAGLVVATVYVLGACGSDPAPAPVKTVTPTPVAGSPSGVPTPTPEAGTPTSAPALPELAQQHTDAGAVAFTEHWFKAAEWSASQGETAYLESISAKDCEYCATFLTVVREGAAAGGSLEGGGFSTADIAVARELPTGALILDLTYEEKAGRQINPDGTTHHEWAAVPPGGRQVMVKWEEGEGWLMHGFGLRAE